MGLASSVPAGAAGITPDSQRVTKTAAVQGWKAPRLPQEPLGQIHGDIFNKARSCFAAAPFSMEKGAKHTKRYKYTLMFSRGTWILFCGGK